MQLSEYLKTTRGWARIFGAISLLPVIFWGYENWVLTQIDEARARNGEFVCGIGAVMLFFVCMSTAFILSAMALGLGGWSYLKTPEPRSCARRIELLIVGNVFVLSAITFVFLLLRKALA
jgi:hypothetical protein